MPDVLLGLLRTIFDDPDDPKDDAFYDQIEWFTSGTRDLIDLSLRAGGSFDFLPHVYTDAKLEDFACSPVD